MSGQQHLFTAKGIARRFTDNPRDTLHFRPLTFPQERIIALIGPSGVGKTTLQNILAGIDPPSMDLDQAPSAQLHLADHSIDLLSDQFPRHLVSNIFQNGYLLSNVQVGMNIAVPMALAGVTPTTDRLSEVLETVGFDADFVPDLLHRKPWQISGGQAQRVGIARAIARDPKVLFADEPTSSLDEDARDRVIEMLRDWVEEEDDRSLIIVSHDLDLVATHADAVMLLHPVDGPGEGQHIGVHQCDKGQSAEDLRLLINAVAAGEFSRAGDDPDPEHAGRAVVTPTRPTATRPYQIARKLALSEMLSRRSGRKLTDGMLDAVSQWDRPAGFISLLKNLPFLSAYASIMVAFVSVAVALAMALAFVSNNERLAQVLTNPENCSLLVTASRDRNAARFETEVLAQLAARPWSSSVAEPANAPDRGSRSVAATSCKTGPAVFERFDASQVFLSAVRSDGSCGRRSLGVSLLPTAPSDPILASSKITQSTGNEPFDPGRTLASIFSDPIYQSRNFVFLTEDMVLRLSEEADIDAAPAQVCLRRGTSDARIFRTGGVVDRLPSPRLRGFEVMMPQSAFLGMVYGAAGPSAPPPQVQVYYDGGGMFDAGQATALETYLDDKFEFRRGDLEKAKRLRSEARTSVVALAVLLVCNIVLFILVTYTEVLNYLKANAQQIAVLRTFGLRQRDAVGLGVVTTAYRIGLAAIPLAGLLVLTALIAPISFGEGVEITWLEMLLGLGVTLATFFVLSICAVFWATRAWWQSGRMLSEIIG